MWEIVQFCRLGFSARSRFRGESPLLLPRYHRRRSGEMDLLSSALSRGARRAPDIDLDIETTAREVIQHVYEK